MTADRRYEQETRVTTTKKAKKKSPRGGTAAGRKVLAAMTEFGDPREVAKAIGTGRAPAGATFTIARFAPPTLPAADVAAVRAGLGLSQAAFAAALYVSIQTVQAWEQGRNPVTGAALRLLTAIRDDLPYWRTKLVAAG